VQDLKQGKINRGNICHSCERQFENYKSFVAKHHRWQHMGEVQFKVHMLNSTTHCNINRSQDICRIIKVRETIEAKSMDGLVSIARKQKRVHRLKKMIVVSNRLIKDNMQTNSVCITPQPQLNCIN